MSFEELFKRGVEALESIANSLGCTKCGAGEVVETLTEAPPEVTDTVVTYPPPDAENRGVYIEMMKKRGIEITDRMRTTSMEKAVKDYDAANPAAGTPPVQDPDDPFAETPSGDDADPFADDSKEEPPPAREDVMNWLQQVQGSKGNAAVMGILKVDAGCTKVLDIPEDKLAAVAKACDEELKDSVGEGSADA